ncbi:hairy-related 5 isoform X2 [Centropristis striata]|nr:hairy-related 5 isoform X2 [Centropristis striata]
MKAFPSAESPRQRTIRRFSKPVMEKRRRERINHSLETLRLLMLDNTNNEKLKNPKVEKAEILESVVNFLKTDREVERGHRPMKRVLSQEQRPTSARQHSYQDGMRSCLLRVSHFITSKSQEVEESMGDTVQESHPSSPGHIHSSQDALSPQHHHGLSHPYLSPCDTRGLLASTHFSDPVWRPWPQ